MNWPAFFELARRQWGRVVSQDPNRYQVGLEAIKVVQDHYERTDQFNLHQQIATLRGQLSNAQAELCHERNLAIRRQRELLTLTKQLERIPQLEHDLRQRDEQEIERLGQWAALGDAPGLFATEALPKLLARLQERTHRLVLRGQKAKCLASAAH